MVLTPVGFLLVNFHVCFVPIVFIVLFIIFFFFFTDLSHSVLQLVDISYLLVV